MDQPLSRSSSSSGIDIAGNRAGFIASNAMSPQPSPQKLSFSQPRKRNSWGHQDNLDPFYSPQPEQAPSSSSTINLMQDDPYPYLHDDPVAHLTNEEDADPERQRRRTIRYSTPQSPLKKTGTAIKQVSTNIRRVSLRVVNMAGTDAVRLPDDEKDADALPDLSKARPIRGRTLACLGPDSKLRLSLFHILLNPWTEPIILVLIITHAIVLTIQASRSLNSPDTPTATSGYFHFWEDWVLVGLFVIFTIEAFARIAVSGFLLDPEMPTSALVTSIFSSTTAPTLVPVQPPTTPNVSQNASVTASRSLSNRFETFQRNLTRPFELSEHTRRPSEPEMTGQGEKGTTRGHTHNPSLIMREASYSSSIFPPPLVHASTTSSTAPNMSSKDVISLPFTLSISLSHSALNRHIPYLRHSWSRIDFISIVSFWVSFALAISGYERGHGKHIAVFRALSVIRTARLLGITSGTTTIMHSLKTARPLLASVAYFVLFAMVLFSIIGMQAFKGSLRRTCHLSPTLGEPEINLSSQFCGGYIDPVTLNTTSYIDQSGAHDNGTIKGYICPLGQICREQSNPNNDLESFDTIYFAALQVIVVASANGWTPLMYSMIDSEFFISCFFFIICVIVLNFWLINLFVAVITNTFSAIRSVTKKSAFGADRGADTSVDDDHDDGWDRKAPSITQVSPTKNVLRKVVQIIQPLFVCLALFSLVLQSTRSIDIGDNHESIMFWGELIITILFDVEIAIRFLATLPEWRAFFSKRYERPSYTYAASTPTFAGSMVKAPFNMEEYGSGSQGRNILDTVLALVTSIIQIPFIRKSSVYPWFTIFQLARFYRVILVVPRMKPLLLAVFGNMYGLANMSLFLILVNYIAALVAIQLLRGDMTSENAMNFGQIFTSFLAIYQVFSSENWTDIMYGAASAEIPLGQSALVIIFIAGWMLFANFIVLQMFIAVINENFSVAEESKKGQQATDYWESHNTELLGSGVKRPAWIRNLNPYRWVKANPDQVKVESLPSGLVLRMQKDIVGMGPYGHMPADRPPPTPTGPRHYHTKSLTMLQRLFGSKVRSDDVPMTDLRHVRNETVGNGEAPDEETERHLELLAAVQSDAPNTQEINDTLYERRAQKADFIRDHPSYDKTFWIFSQKNHFRRWCQKLVQPANGERIFGTAPSPIAHPIFQLIIFLAVAGGIAVESVATPAYRRTFFAEHGKFRGAWFDIAEAAFGLTLVVEFLIKIAADGFIFTPNAYIRSIWNVLDLIIMVGLLINVTTSLIFIGGLSRLTRSLKALRALRLITLMEIMRSTFKSLIISGALRILDAAVLAILYMIPYAVWGLNIFAGKMNQCNDNDVSGAADCVNEYTNTVYGQSFGFLAPRVWDNPAPSTVFSFDTFRASLLILFEIVSLEGWIDVMNVATSITGAGQQPQTNASQANALFFLIYNLLGGVVILTLFISIIIGNFSSKTGTAFLTKSQREWIDLQKLFKRQRPSNRPAHRPSDVIRGWCFDRAIHKHGWWSRTMTVLFVLHIIALMTQTFAVHTTFDAFRNDFFLAITFAYIIDVLVRFTGLGYYSFKANGWNIFDAIVAVGSFGTSLAVRFSSADANNYVLQQMQKLFLVSIAFKLVQRTNSLNQLFKTAVASLPVIVSLIGLWLILFLFFAILFVEVFGLTKWGSGENRNQNYSSIGKALVMLAFMSTGEGWNQYMHDYALVYPRCTNVSATQTDSDCGSIGWAFTLFIAWNLLSMYIFVNMFTGVVVENFSYVFQTSAGGAKSITREEMRSFKKIWGEFANPKTGLLERRDLVKFFGRLNGAFEVRIYPSEYNVRKITAACRAGPLSAYSPLTPRPRASEGVDLNKLDQVLSTIDYSAVRRRRNIYVRLLNEANLEARRQQRDGITFTGMLMLLAHHKLIVDHEALNLKDLVARTEINKLVTDLVNLDRVRSLLTTISYRRRFLAYLQEKRRTIVDSPAVPYIVVDAFPSTPPPGSKDIASMGYDSTPSTPTPVRSYHHRPDASLTIDPSSPGSALQRSSRRHWRSSDASMLSADLGTRSPRDSFIEDDPQNVLSSIQNSMWRDLMSEAMEEEAKTDR